MDRRRRRIRFGGGAKIRVRRSGREGGEFFSSVFLFFVFDILFCVFYLVNSWNVLCFSRQNKHVRTSVL